MSQISTDLETRTVRAVPANPAPARPLFAAMIARLRGFSLLRHIKRKLVQFEQGPEEAIYRASEVAQKNLIATWKQLQAAGVILPLDQVGFSRFSEFEEYGHLLYRLTLAGSVSRTGVCVR